MSTKGLTIIFPLWVELYKCQLKSSHMPTVESFPVVALLILWHQLLSNTLNYPEESIVVTIFDLKFPMIPFAFPDFSKVARSVSVFLAI